MSKILLIDDSAFSRNQMKRILGNEYTYLEAIDGMTGLEMCALDNPNIIILDLTMPDMHGLDVLEKILLLNPGARVIVCSADIQTYSSQKAIAMGAIAFVDKPVTFENLKPPVDKILGRHQEHS